MDSAIKRIIDQKIIEYYTYYYKDELGLKDYERRVKGRLNEDYGYERLLIRYKDKFPFFMLPVENQKVLIDGAGTGQEFFTFTRMGYDAYGIEPFDKAIEILNLKCRYYDVDGSKIIKAYAEQLPFQDNYFDMVWSYTVLEHVYDFKMSIQEIIRVLKPNGWALLVMPNYSHPYEPHYRMIFPTFFPKIIQKIYLKLRRRPTKFIDYQINYITTYQVRNILQNLNVDAFLQYHSWGEEWKDGSKRTLGQNITYYWIKLFGGVRDQVWIVRKK